MSDVLPSKDESLTALVREAIDHMGAWEYDDLRNWRQRAEAALAHETAADPTLHHMVSAWYAKHRMQIPHAAAVELANLLFDMNPFRGSSEKAPAPQCCVAHCFYMVTCMKPAGHEGQHRSETDQAIHLWSDSCAVKISDDPHGDLPVEQA